MAIFAVDSVKVDINTKRLRYWLAQSQSRRTRTRILRLLGRAISRDLRQQIQEVDAPPAVLRAARRTLGHRVKKEVLKVGFALRRVPARFGITHRNVHWLILGTVDRYTSDGAYRGIMPAYLKGWLSRATKGSFSNAVKSLRKEVSEILNQEFRRARYGY